MCEATGLRPIAVDGKACRSAPRNTFGGRLHLVSAWAAGPRVILGRAAVADGSHEAAAIPELLRVPEVKGASVTADAAGCPRGVAEQVRGGGGDYLLAVKGSQPTLRDTVRAVFDRACSAGSAGVTHDGREDVGGGPGRHEERYPAVTHDPEGLPPGWPGVAAVALVGREREAKGTNASTARHDVTSLRGPAEQPAGLVRRRWAVESEPRWCPDVAFREDDRKTAAGRAGANLGLVRRVAASLLKQHPDKGSIKAKRLRAGWDDDFRLQVLQGRTED